MNEGDWFRAGLEAAAKFHLDRGAFTKQMADNLRENPETVPEDIRYRLLADWDEGASQEQQDARLILDLPPPDNMPSAVKEAWWAKEAQDLKAIQEARDRWKVAREKLEIHRQKVKALASLLKEAIAILQTDPPGGSLCQRATTLLGTLL